MAVVKTLIGNVKGPKGYTGAKGDKGDKGDIGATGQRGSRWTQGTKITGTSTTATIFSNSGISDALVNDNYLNTSTGNTYRCTVAGNASTAKWVYSGNIKGPKGNAGEKGDKGDTGATGPKGPQGEYAAVDSALSKTSTNPIQNKAVAEEFEKKLNSDGDSKDLTTTFTSNDSTNVTEWTDVGLLTSGEKHSSLFQKIATMFKNIRYLYHMLGTADISTLGEGANIGTVTGAISKLNSDKAWKTGSLPCYYFDFDSSIGMTGEAFENIKAIREVNSLCFQKGSIIHVKRSPALSSGSDTFIVGSTDPDYFKILCISFYEKPFFVEYNPSGWTNKQLIVTESQ